MKTQRCEHGERERERGGGERERRYERIWPFVSTEITMPIKVSTLSPLKTIREKQQYIHYGQQSLHLHK